MSDESKSKIGVQTSGGKSKSRSDRSLRKGPEKFSNNAAGASREDVVDDSNKRTKMRIKTYEDVAGSDDEFHINRDKVMLDDGPEAKRRRRVQEEGKDWYLYAPKKLESNPRKQRNSCNSPTRKF
jgi:hypothetical protein